MHHNSNNCDSSELVFKAQHVIAKAAEAGQLYPTNLKVAKIYDDDDVSDTPRANGGWADLRDILLCLNMTLGVRQATEPSQ